MCFFNPYVLEKYCEDKLTISYLFPAHFHKHHVNFEKHGCLGAKWSGQVKRFRPTYFDLDYRYIPTLCLGLI